MITRFYFQKVKDSDKSLLEKYFQEKKIGRLKKLLLHGDFELAKLVINAKYHERHNTFVVGLELDFAKEKLNSEDAGHILLEAFDLALDRLINQLRQLDSKKHNRYQIQK